MLPIPSTSFPRTEPANGKTYNNWGEQLNDHMYNESLLVVNTIEDMKNLNLKDFTNSNNTQFKNVYVKDERLDGRGNSVFVFDASSLKPEDGGMVFKPNSITDSETGRWIRSWDGDVVKTSWWQNKIPDSALQYGKEIKIVSDSIIENTIKLSEPVYIHGKGFNTIVRPTNFPADQNIIEISPPADGNARDAFHFSDFYILDDEGVSKDVIYINVAQKGQVVSRMRMKNVFLRTASPTAWAFNVHCPEKLHDAFFLSIFDGCTFVGGINLNGAGDSLNITNCNITYHWKNISVNPGINVNLTSARFYADASQLRIEGNNITADGGAVFIKSGNRTKIINNNIECPYGAGTLNKAIIEVHGDDTGDLTKYRIEYVNDTLIAHNFIAATSNVNHAIYLNYSKKAIIEGNVIGVSENGYGIYISKNAINTIIRANTFVPQDRPDLFIYDEGVGTVGVIQPVGYDLPGKIRTEFLNTWASESNTFYQLRENGINYQLNISGVITNNNLDNSKLEIFKLRSGFAPSANKTLYVGGQINNQYTKFKITVQSDGMIALDSEILPLITLNDTIKIFLDISFNI